MSMSDPYLDIKREDVQKNVERPTSTHNFASIGNKKRLSADLPEEPPAPEEEEEINLSHYTEEVQDSIIKEDDQDIS